MINDLLESNDGNEIVISQWGQYPALIFRGNLGFISRMHNWAINFGVLNPNGGKFRRLSDNSYYILAPESRIINGLREYFAAQILLNHKDNPILERKFSIKDGGDGEETNFEYTYSEAALEDLSGKMANDFWQNKVLRINLLTDYLKTASIDEYKVSFPVEVE